MTPERSLRKADFRTEGGAFRHLHTGEALLRVMGLESRLCQYLLVDVNSLGPGPILSIN